MKLKKLLLAILSLTVVLCFGIFTACNNEDPEEAKKLTYDMSNATWNYTEAYTYDGTEKSIAVTGLPTGVTVAAYTDNAKTNAGTYTAKVTFNYDSENYKKPALADCTWTINKATYDMSNAAWNYTEAYTYDGTEKSIAVTGLPAGVTVAAYTDNANTDAGTYTAKVTFNYDSENYKKPTLADCTWTINKATYDMSNATWNYTEAYTYDGTEKSVAVTGLPAGVTVAAYTDNANTDAGDYTASANLIYDTLNYFKPILPDCSWKINKADITGITFENVSVRADGKEHAISITGIMPKGVTVSYTCGGVEGNIFKKVGRYVVTATLSGKNYNTLTKTATLILAALSELQNMAQIVKDSFGEVPNAWDFLPDKYAKENHILTNEITYDNFVSVKSLPTGGIGKQLYSVYKTLDKTETALSYVSNVYGALNSVVALYQEYINNNPDNYKNYEHNGDKVKLKIELTDDAYCIFGYMTGVCVELKYSTSAQYIEGRVDIANKLSAKYRKSENAMRIALNVFSAFTVDISFEKDASGKVTGFIYDTTGVGSSARLTTSAIMKIDTDYLTVVGNKGDFLAPGMGVNVEVYRNSDGTLCGTEVYETIKTADYDTCWFNLKNVKGINSIKAIFGQSPEEINASKKNVDTIYINGREEHVFIPKYNTKLTVKTSRQYDIEFKTMYFYKLNAENNKYELVEQKIPMLFVQRENLDTYISDIKTLNNGLSVSNTLPAQDGNVIKNAYSTYLTVYQQVKESVTYEMTIDYIGERNAWFGFAENEMTTE